MHRDGLRILDTYLAVHHVHALIRVGHFGKLQGNQGQGPWLSYLEWLVPGGMADNNLTKLV